jgi:membrane-associated phospholipid phosphatase
MPIRPFAASLCVCLALAVAPPAWCQSTGTPAPKFKDLFSPIGGDFKRLITNPNPWILSIGGAGASAAHALDKRLVDMQWSDGAKKALEPGRIVGGLAAQTGAAFATYAVGRALNKPGVATLGADLVRAQIVAQGTTQLLKLTAQRERPDDSNDMSLPSGHSAGAFATASVLQAHYGLKAGIPAYVMASWVATSRLQARKHHLSDVVAGATIGILAGRTISVGRGSARFAIAPIAAPGGIGVGFTRIID